MPLPILDSNLRVGWEPDTPSSDSIVRAFLTNWSNLTAAEIAAHGGQSLIRDDFAAFDVGRPAGFANVVFFLAPFFPEGTDEIVTALDDFFRFNGGDKTGEVYIFSPWLTPDLRPAGWNLMGHPPIMLRAAGGDLPTIPNGLRIEEVRTEASLHAFEQVAISGFPMEGIASLVPGSIFSPAILNDERMKFWLGWEGEQPVSIGLTRVEEGINHVHIIATVPEARRRGYGAALTWQATLADPNLPSVLIASDDGRPVYEKMGYLTLFRFTGWWRARPGS
jgi:Acetyltransferase (GNAT) domain